MLSFFGEMLKSYFKSEQPDMARPPSPTESLNMSKVHQENEDIDGSVNIYVGDKLYKTLNNNNNLDHHDNSYTQKWDDFGGKFKNILIHNNATENECSNYFNKVYEINGECFREKTIETDELVEFEIEETKHGNAPTDINSAETSSEVFPVSIQTTPFGLILNSIIYLSVGRWHTILQCDDTFICDVCDSIVEDVVEHTKLLNHLDNLGLHPPLKKFNLSIIRKIRNNYHCAICNEIITDNRYNEHIEGNDHEENMLFARNRATEILNDLDLHNDNGNVNNDSIKYSRNRINSTSETSGFDSESAEGFYDYDFIVNNNDDDFRSCSDDETGSENNKVSYASVAKRKSFSKFVDVIVDGISLKIKFDILHMINTTKQNQFYCMACNIMEHISFKSNHCAELKHVENLQKLPIIQKYKNMLVRRVNYKYYHCGTCNNLQLISSFDDHVITRHNKKNANKTNEKSSKNTNNGTEKIVTKNVNYNGTDRVIKTNVNNGTDGITTANTNNGTGKIVTKNVNYNGTDRVIKTNVNNGTGGITTANTNNGTGKIVTKNVNYNGTDRFIKTNFNNGTDGMTTANGNQFVPYDSTSNLNYREGVDHVIINNPDFQIEVPFLSFHFIFFDTINFYCGICKLKLTSMKIVNVHVNQKVHKQKVFKTHFEPSFGAHAIRLVDSSLAHCAICNIILYSSNINMHLSEQCHVYLLKTSKSSHVINTSQDMKPKTSVQSNLESGNKNTKRNITNEPKLNKTNESKLNKTNESHLNKTNESSLNKTNESHLNKTNESNENNMTSNLFDDMTVEVNRKTENETLLEDFLYMVIKNNLYIKVSNCSYNGLIPIGDGTRFCFICWTKIIGTPEYHIEKDSHINNRKLCKYINIYDKHLLRRNMSLYHCSVCNIIISKDDISDHLTCLSHTHDLQIDKKSRRNDIKMGAKMIHVNFHKESHDMNVTVPQIKILLSIDIVNSDNGNAQRYKTVVFKDNVLKLPWDAWQGMCKNRNGYRCILCVRDVKNHDPESHVQDDSHVKMVENTFLVQYWPVLLRQVNETSLHCVTCNAEVLNKDYILNEHIKGKKHGKYFAATLTDTISKSTHKYNDKDIFYIRDV